MKARRSDNRFMIVVSLTMTVCVLLYSFVPPFVFCTCLGVCIANTQTLCKNVELDGSNVSTNNGEMKSVRQCCCGCDHARQYDGCRNCSKRSCPSRSCCVVFDKIDALASNSVVFTVAVPFTHLFFANTYLLEFGRNLSFLGSVHMRFPPDKLRPFLCVWRN